jgi:hypothetical protein
MSWELERTAWRRLAALSFAFIPSCAICQPGMIIKDNLTEESAYADAYKCSADTGQKGSGHVRGQTATDRCFRELGYLTISGDLLVRAAVSSDKPISSPSSSKLSNSSCACTQVEAVSRARE